MQPLSLQSACVSLITIRTRLFWHFWQFAGMIAMLILLIWYPLCIGWLWSGGSSWMDNTIWSGLFPSFHFSVLNFWRSIDSKFLENCFRLGIHKVSAKMGPIRNFCWFTFYLRWWHFLSFTQAKDKRTLQNTRTHLRYRSKFHNYQEISKSLNTL